MRSNIYRCHGEISEHYVAWAPTVSEVLAKASDLIRGIESENEDASFQITSPYFHEDGELYHMTIFVIKQRSS